MKIKEITKTVEQVVRTEYYAEDGTLFNSEYECRMYEESALFAVKKSLKRIYEGSRYNFNHDFSVDERIEVFDIQNETDLQNLRKYVVLKLKMSDATDENVKCVFTADTEGRKDFVLDNVTYGHEVIIIWTELEDWCWTYGDGSLNGYLEYQKKCYFKMVEPKEVQS